MPVSALSPVRRLHEELSGSPKDKEESMTIFDKTLQVLEKALDLRSARQRILASNIANEETPHYRASDLNFTEALASASRGRPPVALSATHHTHFGVSGGEIQRVVGHVEEVPAGDLPLDANTVNLELEMAKMSDNAMHYNTGATIMAMKLRGILSAIREGR
jgi:flagellar basal-body rod protein FlgB